MAKGIYRITSPSKKVYIGQSINLSDRMRQHKYSEKNYYLKNSLLKYGFDNHKFEIIHELPSDIDRNILDDYEIFYISQYKSANMELMNLTEGGKSTKMSKELIDRLTLKKIGKKMPDSTRYALKKANVGRKMLPHVDKILSKYRTIERATQMGKMNIGKIRTEENKNKISETLKNKTDNKGVQNKKSKLTDDIVLKIREKYNPKSYPSRKLAKEYDISKTNILDIINRKIWKHI
jgi:group I intron endonuclease